MKDITKDFYDLRIARSDVSIFSDCEDGSAECTRFIYEEKKEDFKDLVKDKHWTISCNGSSITVFGYDEKVLDVVFDNFNLNAEYHVEVKE